MLFLRISRAASAALLFVLLTCSGPSLAQQANEPEREMIAAAERGEIVVVKKLLADRARIDARDQRGRTALLAATQRNRVEVARYLIQEGANVNAKDFIQDTPYLYAAAEGRIEILKMILAAGADVNDTNRYRGTALISCRPPWPCRGGEAPACDGGRQGSRQQPGLDCALGGGDPR